MFFLIQHLSQRSRRSHTMHIIFFDLLAFVVQTSHARETSLFGLWDELSSSLSSDFGTKTWKDLETRLELEDPPLAVSVRDHGAKGDGISDDTVAFELAIAAVERAGKGSVIVPAVGQMSEYLIRPINLTSNMELYISAGATIKAMADADSWPLIPGAPSYGQGRDHQGPRHTSLLHGEHLANVTIRGAGNSSVIDGQGEYWWYRHLNNLEGNNTRGHMIEFMYSKEIRIFDIALHNSPFWNNHFFDCDGVHVRGVNIVAPDESPNTDGFDPDSSTNVLIESSWYQGGDDCVAVKSGWDCFGVEYGKPSVNITIRNMSCHGPLAGIAIGSEMSGGVENVTVSNCHFTKSNQPAHIKTGPSRGGFIHNIFYNDLR
jgi:polygalacturonase